MREIAVHLLLECRIGFGLRIGVFQFEDERHQRFGDEAAAIDAEMAVLVRPGAEGIGLLHGHAGTRYCDSVEARRRGVPRRADEGADFIGILLSRRALDAGGDIDGRARA